jgi:outer membrane protein OmpA-like peptidoglycan-associated protein
MTINMNSMIKIGFGFFIPLLVLVTGCGPSQQEMQARQNLANAQTSYARAKANPDVEGNAQVAMMEAGRAVEAASQAKTSDEMDHLAYLAEKKTRIAVATAEEQVAEREKKALSQESDRLMAQGRAREQEAKMDARESKLDARESNRDARESSAEARLQTQKAEMAATENEKLQLEIAAMKGKMTDRGIVLTLGDVLFATGTANLSAGADDQIEKLATFMRKYPDRNVIIEGHTDSTGSEATNLNLSLKRANAVSNRLIAKGSEQGRITTKGLGEVSPVASNDTVTGRMQNRRVEVIVLNPGVNP